MKACCYVCESRADGTQEELLNLHWSGSSGNLNGNPFKFELCSKHQDPKIVSDILDIVRKGVKVFRNKDGEYFNETP